jgi:hypothetical protein
VILRIACPATREFGDEVSGIEVFLFEEDGELPHAAALTDERWLELGAGWDTGFRVLSMHLAAGAGAEPAEAAARMASDEGRAFMTLIRESRGALPVVGGGCCNP